jgi:diguanylate cyclase (GGDEF)-like protein
MGSLKGLFSGGDDLFGEGPIVNGQRQSIFYEPPRTPAVEPPAPLTLAQKFGRGYQAIEQAPAIAASYYSPGGEQVLSEGLTPQPPSIGQLVEEGAQTPDQLANDTYAGAVTRKLAGAGAELLASPTNAALLLGTAGLGNYGTAGRIGQRAISLGFAGSMIPGAAEKLAQAEAQREAEGFTPRVAGQFAGAGLEAGFAGLAGAHAFSPFPTLRDKFAGQEQAVAPDLVPETGTNVPTSAPTIQRPAFLDEVDRQAPPIGPGPELGYGRGGVPVEPVQPEPLSTPQGQAPPVDAQPGEQTANVAPAPAPASPEAIPERRSAARNDVESILSGLPPEQADALRQHLRATEDRADQAETDTTTGLPLRSVYEREAATHQGAIASLDLAGVKWINDNLGHPAGDSLLAAAGEALRSEPGVKVYRTGGDEFRMLADTPEAARAAAESVQRRFKDATFSYRQPDGKVVTYTGGRIDYGVGQGATPEAGFSAADQALYESRQQAEARGERAPRGSEPTGLAPVAPEGGTVVGEPSAPPQQLRPPSTLARPSDAEAPLASVPREVGPQGDASGAQTHPHGFLSDSKLFSDSPDAQAIRVKGFDSLDRNRQSVVLSHMARLIGDDHQVFRSVVESVPVSVMNDLASPEFPAEKLLHDPAVLAHRLAAASNEPVFPAISRLVEAVAAEPEGISASGATERSTLPLSDRVGSLVSPDSGAALGANGFGYGHASSVFSPEKTQVSEPDLRPRIKEVFKGLPIKELPGGYELPTPSGKRILIKPTGEISFDAKALEKGHGKAAVEKVASGEERLAGATFNLGRDALVHIADHGVLPHESVHVFLDHFASAEERATLQRRFESQAKTEGRAWDEVAADAYNKWFDRPKEVQQSLITRVFERIKDFVSRVAEVFRPTEKGVFRKIESGEAFQRSASEAVPRGADQAFAAQKRPAFPPGSPERDENFRGWFHGSKVVDETGAPKTVYHGTRRPDRLGTKFRPDRATSGPMPFFTEDPSIASGYSTNKADTSLEQPADYSEWFKVKPQGARTPVDLDRAWYHLSSEERQRIADNLPHVTYADETNYDKGFTRGGPDDYGLAGADHWRYEIQQAKGNVLKAAKEIWLAGGNLFNDEEKFMDILRLGGMDMKKVTFDDPYAEHPGVLAAHLAIKNPFETDKVTPEIIDRLQKAANRTRVAPEQYGADPWDKRTRDPQSWMEMLRENPDTAWTSIPDWVTRTLRQMGYDGIKDTGGKMGGEKHVVWVPFEPTQIKSAIGNRGTFDPNNPDIRYATAPKAPPQIRPITPEKEAEIQQGERQATGNPPRVEENVANLRAQEIPRRLGNKEVGGQSGTLDRENPLTQADYTAQRKELKGKTDDYFYNTLKKRTLDPAESQEWDARVQGKALGINDAQQAFDKAQAKGDRHAAATASQDLLAKTLDYVAAQRAYVNDGTAAARALQARAKIQAADITASNPDGFLRKLFREIPGISDQQALDLVHTFKTDPGSLPDLVRAALKPTFRQKFFEAWRAGMLGPTSFIAKAAGDTSAQALSLARTIGGTAIERGAAKIQGRVPEREWAEAYAHIQAIQDGVPTMLHTFLDRYNNESFDVTGRLDTRAVGAIGKATILGKEYNVGRAVRTPYRVFEGISDAFSQLSGRAEVYRQAMRKAIAEGRQKGLSDSALTDFVEKRASEIKDSVLNFDGKYRDIEEAAKKAGEYNTFSGQFAPDGFVDRLGRARKAPGVAGTIAETILPFYNTPLHIAGMAAEHTPLNFARLAYKAYKGELKGGALAEEMVKPIVGTLVGLTFAAAAKQGIVTGSGPADPRQKQNLLATGWQPYSIRIGEKYVSYHRLEPISSIMGLAADLVESHDEQTKTDLVNKITASVATNFTNKTFLQGLTEATGAISDPVRFAGQFVKGLEGSLVPAAIGRVAQAIDPKLRETSATDLSPILAKIPFASMTLPEKRGATGTPVERPDTGIVGRAYNALSPFAYSEEQKGPIHDLQRVFVDIDYVPSTPPRRVAIPGSHGKKVELTDEEYRTLQDADEKVSERLANVVQNPQFKRMDPLEQKAYLRRQYDRAGTQAQRQLYALPAFRARVQQARQSA